MKSLVINNLDFEKLSLMEKSFFYVLKTVIFLVFSFSKTFLYTLYFLLTTIGIFGNTSNFITNLFFSFVLFLAISNLVLLFLLNYKVSKDFIEKLIGADFILRYWKNSFHGSFSLFLLILGIILPIGIEQYSFRERELTYQTILDLLFKSYAYLFKAVGGIIDEKRMEVLKNVNTPEMENLYERIETQPKPQNGIIVDILREFDL